ncbi:hypothetical protein [Streptomyces sp. NPDC093094]|uniref:hypothetical protein n=1 Tax=Streptomyces sp. NPDC093094 TaxID=3366026 RepID=UPI003816F8DF
MGSEEPVCPDCGQRVDTVVRRHKTLGAWVPKWEPGPCRNPDCEASDAYGVVRRPPGPEPADGQQDAPEPQSGQPAAEQS